MEKQQRQQQAVAINACPPHPLPRLPWARPSAMALHQRQPKTVAK